MAGGLITSANAIFMLTFTGLFNAPVRLENFSADRAFEAEAIELAETKMSIDGFLNRGYVPRAVSMTVTLSAASKSIPYFDALIMASQQSRTVITLGGEISIPDTGRKFTLLNGCLTNGSVFPSAGTTLEDQTYTLQWERVLPAGI
ncbi:phage tail fiber protein [Swingsia samuiensis]|uniref:Uncharacterized protein n=1 Tax=Swingsia samuiensis TaxID=1293412 RepID=A0A4Y6UL90_9PROT|nr:hypothetical protein [Swingsia samuiensis]QDH17408.1 hypothetical protein E3D00_07395 [Swingsia samuiensis]